MEFQSYSLTRAALANGNHEPVSEYGTNAYRVNGPEVDVVYWALGNGWSGIISVIPHDGDESHIVDFWNRLLETVEEEG